MTRIGVIREIEGRSPFICMIVDDIKRAESLAIQYHFKSPFANCQYYVRTVPDNACTGDVL